MDVKGGAAVGQSAAAYLPEMPLRTIVVVNQSSLVSDADFQAAVAACQRQVNEHFGPAWGGISCQLATATAAPGVPYTPAGETIFLLDDSDQQGALGYHELTPADQPIGYIFIKTSQQAGDPWQTTLSHELLEQLVDPYVDSCVCVQLNGRTAVVEYEVADPVENDTYAIDGVPVSNFVLPTWFQSPDTPGIKGPFDYMGKLSAPLSLTPGGYIAFAYVRARWQQMTAEALPTARPEKYARHGHRRKIIPHRAA